MSKRIAKILFVLTILTILGLPMVFVPSTRMVLGVILGLITLLAWIVYLLYVIAIKDEV